MDFEYKIEIKNKVIIASLKGELIEKHQAGSLIDELAAMVNQSNRLVLDMKKLKYLNSVGLSVMINILSKFRSAGGEVVVCCLSKKVKELFVITKLNSVFTVKENMDQALDSFID